MPADASIFQNYLRAPKSIQDYDNEAMQAQSNALAMKTQQAQYNSLVQQQQQEDAIKNYLGGGANLATPEGQSGLYRVAGSKAGSILKDQSALARDRAAADKDKTESGLKIWQSYRDQASMIRNPQEAAAWIANGYHDPVIGPYLQRTGSLEEGLARIPQDQAGFEAWRNGVGMNVDKLAAHALQQQQLDETVRHNTTSEGLTKRGQDLTDKRARDFNAVQVEANNIKRDEKKATQDLTKNSQIASFDTMLGTLDRLSKHPGLSRSVGIVGALPTMPGSDSANFQAELNTFQSQAFLPMVAQLKGMGALSDAEGKKLTAAVGALDPKMGEQAFRDSVARITSDMEDARARVSGQPRTPKPKLSAQDQQAADWANANPNDPRAAQIKKRLGL